MRQNKKRDLFFVSCLVFVSILPIIYFRLGYLPGALLAGGLPSLYLSFVNKKIIKKSALFSALFGIPLSFVADYICTVSSCWHENGNLGIQIFGTYPIDVFLWIFIYIYFIISFYEHFLDEDKYKGKISKNIDYLIGSGVLLVAIFLVIYYMHKEFLVLSYFYLIFDILIFIAPTVVMCWRYPSLVRKMAIQGSYFFILSLAYELVAVSLNHWSFSFKGWNLIGRVDLFGVPFAFEELIWIIFAVPGILCWYELFADNKK